MIGDSKLPATLALPLAEPDPDALADPETVTATRHRTQCTGHGEEMAEVTGANGLPGSISCSPSAPVIEVDACQRRSGLPELPLAPPRGHPSTTRSPRGRTARTLR